MKNFLVIDSGSSQIKCLITDCSGNISAESSVAVSAVYKKDMVEYNAEDLYLAHLKALDEILDKFKGEISAFGICCQRSSFLFFDKNSKPLTDILSWQDGRASKEMDEVDISQADINAVTGLYKTPYYSAFKMRHLLKNDPSLLEKSEKGEILFGSIATYFLYRFSQGKIFVIDPTMAQRTLLFNINKNDWDENLLSKFSVNPSIMPKIIPTVSDNCVNINYSGRNLPFCAMAGDQQAAAAPFINKDIALANFGTGAFLLVPAGEKSVNSLGLLSSIAYVNKNKAEYMLEGTVNSCGTFIKWLSVKLNVNCDDKNIDICVKKSKKRIFVLPAIGGIGSPYWDYSTPTSFIGFDPESDYNDLIKASLEGIIFLLNESFLPASAKVKGLKQIAVSGGLSDIDYLPQFLSDITGLETFKSSKKEATAMGLAYLMAEIFKVDISSWNLTKPEKIFYPLINQAEREKLIFDWKNNFNLLRKNTK